MPVRRLSRDDRMLTRAAVVLVVPLASRAALPASAVVAIAGYEVHRDSDRMRDGAVERLCDVDLIELHMPRIGGVVDRNRNVVSKCG